MHGTLTTTPALSHRQLGIGHSHQTRLTTQNLTTLPEFVSHMFTALIYSYTGKLSHDQC